MRSGSYEAARIENHRATNRQFSVNESAIPKTVLDLIQRHIQSVEHLEILLLLFDSPVRLTNAEIFQHIQSSQPSIDLRVEQLLSAGLIERGADQRVHFSPGSDSQTAVGALAECYRTMRVRVIEAIYAPRPSAVNTFAEAFRFKRSE